MGAHGPTAPLRRDLAPAVDAMVDMAEQSAAVEWLDWCKRSVAEHDPSIKPITMPTVKLPGYGKLAEFRIKLGFGGYW
jgi:hypothetical protein